MSLAQTNSAMDKAWGVIKQLSADEEARLQAEAREKLRLDMDGMYKTGHRVGREEGIAEGRAEKGLLRAKMTFTRLWPSI
jgi:hypothetical protein